MSNEVNTSSDKSFYLIMLALIVGMGFYVSYDMEQRYGSGNSPEGSDSAIAEGSNSTTADGSSSTSEGSSNTIEGSVNTTVVESPAIQVSKTPAPAAKIPAIVTTPETTDSTTTTVVTVEKVPAAKLNVESQQGTETSVREEAATIAESAPTTVLPTMSEAAKTVADKVVESGSQAAQAVSSFIPFTKTEEVPSEVVAPVVEEVIEETAAVVESTVETIPAVQPVQEYNPYDYSYRSRPRRPYPDNYYPQQRPYGYPDSNPYGYGNPYANPYPNPYPAPSYPTPYGYGYDQ